MSVLSEHSVFAPSPWTGAIGGNDIFSIAVQLCAVADQLNATRDFILDNLADHNKNGEVASSMVSAALALVLSLDREFDRLTERANDDHAQRRTGHAAQCGCSAPQGAQAAPVA